MGAVLDAVIVGGGAAGLSLAAHLAAGGWDDRRVVVVDDPSPACDNRSWGYWSAQPLLVDRAAERSWRRFAVHACGRTSVVDLDPYRYRVVRMPALRALTASLMSHAPGFEVAPGRVTAVQDGRRSATVVVGTHRLETAWVFDSTGLWTRGLRAADAVGPDRAPHRMAVTGRWVRTADDAFDPGVPWLCDFRLPSGRAAFVHVLPDGARHAFVEHTEYLAAGARAAGDPTGELTGYLRGVLGVGRFDAGPAEHATIPLCARTANRRGHRVLAIGAVAGLVRPSSGYGFEPIQRDSAAAARSLLRHGHPFDVPRRPWRHRALDRLFLRAVADDPAMLEPAFAAMFGADDPLRVLRFLDDASTPVDDARLVAGLPPWPYVRALLPHRARRVEEDLLHPRVPGDEPALGLVRDPLDVGRHAMVGELDLRCDEQPPRSEHRRDEHRDGIHGGQ